MKFDELLEIIGDEPVFETGFLLAGDTDPADVTRALSRWTKAGRLLQLRRGLYALAPPYRRRRLHPFVVANRLVSPSYVSLETALSHHGLIPEHVPVTTSVTTRRPQRRETPLGPYLFRRVKRELFWGFAPVEVESGREAFVATPEKALLDLVYLRPGGDKPGFLHELRLQNLDRLDCGKLLEFARRTGRPKLERAATQTAARIAEEVVL